MEATKPSKAKPFTYGMAVGLLLAGTGLYMTQDQWMPEPVTITKVAVKTVTKNVPVTVIKEVPVVKIKEVVREVEVVKEKRVMEKKLYRATVLDENGKVLNQLVVTGCKFIIVGAEFTKPDGSTIKVDGSDVRIEQIK